MGFMATNMQKIKVIDQFISKNKVKTHLPTDRRTRPILILVTITTTIHLFSGLSSLSRTTWVRRYQKGKTSLDLNEARGRMLFLTPNGVKACTEGNGTECNANTNNANSRNRRHIPSR